MKKAIRSNCSDIKNRFLNWLNEWVNVKIPIFQKSAFYWFYAISVFFWESLMILITKNEIMMTKRDATKIPRNLLFCSLDLSFFIFSSCSLAYYYFFSCKLNFLPSYSPI
jgi:hypothetical protein